MYCGVHLTVFTVTNKQVKVFIITPEVLAGTVIPLCDRKGFVSVSI